MSNKHRADGGSIILKIGLYSNKCVAILYEVIEMKNIVITREKSLSGSLMKYYCILNLSKEEFLKYVGTKSLHVSSTAMRKSSN